MSSKTITFLFGNDEFAIRRRLAEFASTFTDSSLADLNITRLEARTMGEEDLNNAVNSLPFLASQRLVLLANPSERYSTPPLRKKFFDFLEKVPPSTQLVIYEHVDIRNYKDKSRQEQEDARHWLVKWMKKAGLKLERHALPAVWEMTGWIIQQAREQGGSIDQAAAARLAELVGPDTRQAAQEIAKLLAYVNWARPVKAGDVEAVSLLTAEPDIFAMVDALATGNGRSAQNLLHRLLKNDDPFSVWGMVVRQFRLLLLAREVIDGHGSQRQLEQVLGLHAFVAEKVYAQAKRFSQSALERIYRQLLDIDEAAKTGQVTLDLALETLVVELAG